MKITTNVDSNLSAETEDAINTNVEVTLSSHTCTKPNVGSSLSPTTKDWTGNKNRIYKTLGATSHTEKEREENDYYATEPKAVKMLLELEKFAPNIWECACGEGHLAKEIKANGFDVFATDLIDRGFGMVNYDFLTSNNTWDGDIITNPPYKFAKEFIEKSLSVVEDGCKVAMFLKIQFLEGKARKKLFETYPPKTIYVSSSRLLCAKNGDFEGMIAGGGSAVAYAWFVWQKGFKSETIVKWFN